jgi:hypothetical protein
MAGPASTVASKEVYKASAASDGPPAAHASWSADTLARPQHCRHLASQEI